MVRSVVYLYIMYKQLTQLEHPCSSSPSLSLLVIRGSRDYTLASRTPSPLSPPSDRLLDPPHRFDLRAQKKRKKKERGCKIAAEKRPTPVRSPSLVAPSACRDSSAGSDWMPCPTQSLLEQTSSHSRSHSHSSILVHTRAHSRTRAHER